MSTSNEPCGGGRRAAGGRRQAGGGGHCEAAWRPLRTYLFQPPRPFLLWSSLFLSHFLFSLSLSLSLFRLCSLILSEFPREVWVEPTFGRYLAGFQRKSPRFFFQRMSNGDLDICGLTHFLSDSRKSTGKVGFNEISLDFNDINILLHSYFTL